MKKLGTLTLVATPIEEENILHPKAQELLLGACEQGNALFCVEEAKSGRRRWLRYGLPREKIADFILYNEHTRDKEKFSLLSELKSGKDVYLMSDCGLPAFCDPGAELVDLCHQHGTGLRATPFCNSMVLAVALSGFCQDQFFFGGFLPKESSSRKELLKKYLKQEQLVVLMETPYRYKKLREELRGLNPEAIVFFGPKFRLKRANSLQRPYCKGPP